MTTGRASGIMVVLGLAWVITVHVVFFWGVPLVDHRPPGLPPPTGEFNRRQYQRMTCQADRAEEPGGPSRAGGGDGGPSRHGQPMQADAQ